MREVPENRIDHGLEAIQADLKKFYRCWPATTSGSPSWRIGPKPAWREFLKEMDGNAFPLPLPHRSRPQHGKKINFSPNSIKGRVGERAA